MGGCSGAEKRERITEFKKEKERSQRRYAGLPYNQGSSRKGDFAVSGLQGRVALVTGASQGIGRACAIALAGAGATVALCARNVEKLEAVAEEINRDPTHDDKAVMNGAPEIGRASC